MGGSVAKQIREDDVAKGKVTGKLGKCIGPDTVSKEKMTLKLKDLCALGGTRWLNAEVLDSKDQRIYTLKGEVPQARMFVVKVMDADGKLVCVAVSKDVTHLTKVTFRILRQDQPSYPDQVDFASWARMEMLSPLYAFGRAEVSKSLTFQGTKVTYSITKPDEDGEPKNVPVYEAKLVAGGIMGMGSNIMGVDNMDGLMVAKIDQPDYWDVKELSLEVGENVDIVAVALLRLYLGATRGTIW